MANPYSYDLQGQGGGRVITSASGAVTGTFRWIQVVTDTVFSALSSSNVANASALQTVTIPAGVGLGGRFESITVTSGVVIAYNI
jgi:TRAP-type C4-dicarboxylate transport system permease large subunit